MGAQTTKTAPGAASERWRATCAEELHAELGRTTGRLVVIDDDPTGTQTVHDVPVLTRWSVDDLVWGLRRGRRITFVSTNTRSMAAAQARAVVAEVARNAFLAAERLDLPVTILSRGDSTLRGHLWTEVQAVVAAAADRGRPVDAVVFVPAFVEAGRVTVDGEHCLIDGGVLVPLSATDYARDATFGYTTSFLPRFVADRSGGALAADDVERIGLDLLRDPTPGAPADRLAAIAAARTGRPRFVVADAADVADVHRIGAALLRLERDGVRLVVRSAPSLVGAFGGSVDPPTLDETALAPLRRTRTDTAGGLTVVGSHVGLSSRQLAELARRAPRPVVELGTDDALLDDVDRIAAVADRLVEHLRNGPAVLATARRVRTGPDGAASLEIATKVADALVAIVRRVLHQVDPAYLVGKGGITSSTLFSRALGASRAMVRGSLLPGQVSVWEPVDGIRPHLPYVVFAGNVGTDAGLADVVARLEGDRPAALATGSRS